MTKVPISTFHSIPFQKITDSVHIDDLGICEHCGQVLRLHSNFVSHLGSMIQHRCSKCGRVLTLKSAGREVTKDSSYKGKKVFWVGSDFKWTRIKPVKNFELDQFFTVVT